MQTISPFDVDVNWDRIILLVIAGAGGAWALFSRLAPQMFTGWSKSRLDEQEHRQAIEQEQFHYQVLNAGWANEQITVQLQEHSQFARDVVYKELQDIKSQIGDVNASINRLERKQMQFEQKQTILVGTLAEMYDNILRRKDAE